MGQERDEIQWGGLDHYNITRDLVLSETHAVTHQKTSLLLVINTEYLFAWIGQIKILTLIVNEQLIHAIFFCRLVREIIGEVRAPSENLHYTASAIAALQHAAEHFLVDLLEHSNILEV